MRADGGAHLSYLALLSGWLRLGSGEAWLRSLSVVFAVLSVALLFRLARDLFGVKVALTASLLLAVNPYFLNFARQARGYTMLTAAMIASASCVASAATLSSSPRRPLRWAAVWAVVGLYTHVSGALVVLALVLSTGLAPRGVIQRREARRIVAGVSLACLPLGALYLLAGSGGFWWLPDASARQVFATAFRLAGGRGTLPGLLVLILALAGSIVALHTVLKNGRSTESWRTGLPLIWAGVPVGVLLGYSTVRPMFATRYLVATLPAVCLLAAVGLACVSARLLPALLPATVLTLVVFFSLPRVTAVVRAPGSEDWRGTARTILERSEPDVGVIFGVPPMREPFFYHARALAAGRPLPDVLVPRHGWLEETQVPRLTSAPFDGTRVPSWYLPYEGLDM
ncbi:MAG: glycosyltransferase family 39 protein, partial [Anaerolineales bacterium]